MHCLDISLATLNDIFFNGLEFSKALKKNFTKEDTNQDQHDASAVVGCVLRHYLSFEEALLNLFENLDQHVLLACCIPLANSLFLKRFDKDAVLEWVNSFSFKIEFNIYKDFVESVSAKENIIPDNIGKDSVKYLSLRFNTPYWLVKMWMNQYGKGITFNILRSISKRCEKYLFLNQLLMRKDRLIRNEELYTDFNCDGVSRYIGNIPLNRQSMVKKHILVPIDIGIVSMCQNFTIESFQKVAFYLDSYDPIFVYLVNKFNLNQECEVICSPKKNLYNIKSELDNCSIKNYRINEVEASAIITVLSSKVDYFFISPNSSNFSNIKNCPDFFLHFNVADLDNILERQKSCLYESSDFINVNGRLVYYVYTVNKKENDALISSFLKDKPNFRLVKHETIFPFTKRATSFYYAILERVE